MQEVAQMEDEPYYPIRQAAELASIPLRTLHYWVESGKVPYVIASKRKRGRSVRLSDVRHAAGVRATESKDNSANAGELMQLHQNGEHEQHGSVSLRSSNASNALILHLEGLYRDTIASKDALILELRRRAEEAEHEAGNLRQQLAALPGPTSSTSEAERRPWWRFWGD